MTNTNKSVQEPWRTSRAKTVLKELLESDNLYMEMAEHELYQMSELFRQYDEDRFASNAKNLKKAIKKDKGASLFEENALAHDRSLFPKQATTFWGYAHWDVSDAKKELRKDVHQKNIVP
jgi:hypothetical protein